MKPCLLLLMVTASLVSARPFDDAHKLTGDVLYGRGVVAYFQADQANQASGGQADQANQASGGQANQASGGQANQASGGQANQANQAVGNGGGGGGAMPGVPGSDVLNSAHVAANSLNSPLTSDIEIHYKDSPEKPEAVALGKCFSFTNNQCQPIEYVRFASATACFLYTDETCEKEKLFNPFPVLFPPLVKVPNLLNAGNAVLKAYNCYSPTDNQVLKTMTNPAPYLESLRDPSKFASQLPNPQPVISAVVGSSPADSGAGGTGPDPSAGAGAITENTECKVGG